MQLIRDLLESYCTLRLDSEASVRSYRSIVSEWINFLGDTRDALDFEISDIMRFLAAQKGRKGQRSRLDSSEELAWGTIQHKIGILSYFYDYVASLKYIEVNHFKHPQFTFRKKKSDPKRPHELVPFSKVQEMIDKVGSGSVAGLCDRAWIATFFGTGIRSKELRSLTVGDLKTTDAGTPYFRIRRAKRGYREVPIPDWNFSLIVEYLAARKRFNYVPESILFARFKKPKTSAPYEELPGKIPESTLYRRFVSAAVEAGLPATITPHCARVTYVTKQLDNAIDIHEVADAVGHSSITVTEKYRRRYLSLDDSPVRKVRY